MGPSLGDGGLGTKMVVPVGAPLAVVVVPGLSVVVFTVVVFTVVVFGDVDSAVVVELLGAAVEVGSLVVPPVVPLVVPPVVPAVVPPLVLPGLGVVPSDGLSPIG